MTSDRNNRIVKNRQEKNGTMSTIGTKVNVQRESLEELDQNSQITLVKGGCLTPDSEKRGT